MNEQRDTCSLHGCEMDGAVLRRCGMNLDELLDCAIELVRDAENGCTEGDGYVLSIERNQWLRRAEVLALVVIAKELQEIRRLCVVTARGG